MKMTTSRVSIILPFVRPEMAKQCIELIHENAGISRENYEIVSEEDIERVGCPKMVKKLVGRSNYDLVMFISDDTAPQRNFLRNALVKMKTLPDSWGMVGLNDKKRNGNLFATHWLISKKMLPLLDGELYHTGYKHVCVDRELTERAQGLGRYVWADDAVVSHIDTPGDKDKLRIYSKKWKEHDQELLRNRRQNNWKTVVKKVSVIIANRNDLAMLSVTVRSCLEELKPLGSGNGEVVICDNSDEAIYKRLNSVLPTGYIREGTLSIYRQPFPCLFSARETAIKHSEGDYIICLDSHMIVGRDMILDLVNFMDSKQDDPTVGFAHAPINWAHHHESRSRHDRDMSKHELGPWGTAYDHERMISWKGMPWICRREWFSDRKTGLGGYGALSHHRLSWGGGDLHIGIKPWLLGFKNWAVPTSPGIHIGPFPKLDTGPGNPHSTKVAKANAQDRYRLWSVSGNGPHTVGFLVSCYILGGEPLMQRNKAMLIERFGRFIDVDKHWEGAIEMGKNEKKWLDVRKVMTFEKLVETRPWEN